MNLIRKITNSHAGKDEEFVVAIKKIIGYRPRKIEFYKEAFTHSSLKKMNDAGVPMNYERLEFLGDAILGAVIANYLFKKIPAGDEGYLTQMRSKIVSREHLNELGKDLDLIKFVASSIPNSNFGDNIHGNLFEALIGAIHSDRGYSFTEKFIFRFVIEPYVDIERLEGKITSYKSVLIEWSQKNKKKIKYHVYEDTGNDTLKHFSVKLHVDQELISKGRATSKKKAEEIASKRAYYRLKPQIEQ
ncbi:ribonuclease III [Lutimonas saemankumensis]|uniref:ribonuclease III n=1 Tax=Lutimonas saemankumensis TaxID=483016 RepID=UPI001CD20E08|nr:ribonuclease III [Lutimonas saemankumensis]MCA0933176.1 ribonuclease III [Lutimonas saemankumensis]